LEGTTVKRLLVVAVIAAFWGGVAHAQTPDRVKAMCGDRAVPWESLCNVDPGLHEAFVLIERIGGDPDFIVRNRLSAMIRDRHAAIDWHPNLNLSSIHPGILGLYDISTSRVYVPQALKGEPLRVRTAVLAHELTHAAWEADNLGAGMSGPLACLSNEALAYQVGMMIYARVYLMTGEGDAPRSRNDQFLMGQILDGLTLSGGQQFTREGLDRLSARHLATNGYLEKCAQRA
jgi:hypothetical protein